MRMRNVVFVDHGYFAAEGFTSGLMIIIKEILKEFRRLGMQCSIAMYERNIHHTILSCGFDLLIREPDDERSYESWLRSVMDGVRPEITITHVPAIDLPDNSISALRVCREYSRKQLALLADPLFPKREDSDHTKYDAYYEELGFNEVLGVGNVTRRNFEAITGIPTTELMNPYNISDFETNSRDERSARYISMVNFHPLKGTEIFIRIAREMPDEEFLLVKNWPDAPDPTDIPNNIRLVPFFEDVRDFYRQTKILLVPSLWIEGPARVVVEALFNQIPTIAHNIGSLADFKTLGAFFVEPPNGIEFELYGTVLTPRFPSGEADRVVQNFVELIRNIKNTPALEIGSHTKILARAYIEGSREMLTHNCRRWVDALR